MTGGRRPIVRRSLIVFAMLISLSGCYRGPGSPHPVDAALAKDTLVNVLEEWKNGKTLTAFQEQHEDVVVQDLDWLQGRQLTEFELLDEGRPVDANLHCDVRLVLIDAQRKPMQKTVTYLVGTSPRKTVFRQIIP